MGWFPSNKVRLFKRQEKVRFHFPVHERVEPSLKTSGVQIAYCTVPVHHYGHLNEVRNRKKAEKYYELGYAKLNEMKDDPAAIRELAAQAGQLERWTEAIELWQRLLELRPNYLEALINMAAAHWQMGDYHQSLMWSRRAVACDPNAREARINLANSLLFLGETTPADVELEALIEQDPNYTAALFMHAVASVCMGERQQAETACNVIVRHTPVQAVIMAADDLATRFEDSGLTSQARSVREDLKQILSKIETNR
jgi:tetratricopeptide (TPR) repeat protein